MQLKDQQQLYKLPVVCVGGSKAAAAEHTVHYVEKLRVFCTLENYAVL